MRNVKMFLTAAVLLFPLCAGARDPGPAGNPSAGAGSADDKAPAVRSQRKKNAGAAVPQSAVSRPEHAQGAGAAGEDLSDPDGDRFEAKRKKSRVSAALGALSALRISLTIYHGDTEGSHPPDLRTLAPKWIDHIPEIAIPGYAKTNKVTVVKTMKTMDLREVVTDTGGWLYIADPKSRRWGEVVIDSVKLYKGKPLYEQ